MTVPLKRIKEHIRFFTRTSSDQFAAAVKTGLNSFTSYHFQATPNKINRLLTGGLILVFTGISLYWFMQILQTPSSSASSTGTKGAALASNQNIGSAHTLFGEKPIAAQNIFLRGLVVTSKNTAGSLDGFAIFEINGKPTNAIAIGEGLGNGLTLKSIKSESATLLYQGQELEFVLSKSKPTSIPPKTLR